MTLNDIVQYFDNWKKISGMVVTLIVFATGIYGIYQKVDSRWVKTEAYAADQQISQGRADYQVNEIKLGLAQIRLDTFQNRVREFASRPGQWQTSDEGLRYKAYLERSIAKTTKEIEVLEESLKGQRDAALSGRRK